MGEVPEQVVTFTYANHRGEVAVRRVVPIRLRFAATEWHPEPQWLLDGRDLDRGAERSFALADIRDWDPGRRHP